MPEIQIPYNFTPREYQIPFLDAMESGYKRAVIVFHRRSGKDKTFINFTVAKMMERVGLYAYLFPNYNQGRKVIWEGSDRAGFPFLGHFPEEIITKKNNTSMSITLKNGSRFQIFGTDDIDTLRGTGPVGCVFSEYSYQIDGAWDAVRPMLLENDGWAIFNFTPHGRNHAWRLANMAMANKEWFFQSLTVDDTKMPDGSPVMSPADIQRERDEGMSEPMILQEYYNSFNAQLETCFFGDSLDRHDQYENGMRGELDSFKLDWSVKTRTTEIKWEVNPKGILEVWDPPYRMDKDWDNLEWTKRYAIGSDIGEGLKQDYSVAYVYDRKIRKLVARMRSNTIDAHQWADYLDQLSLFYDGAIIVPERTGAGITTCKRLWDLRANVYYNMIAAKAGRATSRVVGWVETKQAKWDMAGDFREHLKTADILVQDAILLQECSVFVIKENKKIEAEDGFTDDCVIAACLAIQGGYYLGVTPKQTGEQKLKDEAHKSKLDELDPASRSAAMEYEDLLNKVAQEQEMDRGMFY